MEKNHEIEVNAGTECSPCKVGALDCPNPTVVRIIHISDTHLRHNEFLKTRIIPDGDILVHTGDFTNYGIRKRWDWRREFDKDTTEINTFFGKLPHKHKIFVAGNHEMSLSFRNADTIQERIPNAIYLEDKSVTLEGIKFYGAPWNNWRIWAFSRAYGLCAQNLGKKWQLIPDDTDVVVTHMPPEKILDTGRKKFFHSTSDCDTCPRSPHPNYVHWGCPVLRETMLHRVRPAAHLFGHLHGNNDLMESGSVLFSNAAMRVTPNAHVIDFYLPGASD